MRKPDHGIEPGIGVGGEAREEPTNEANAARWEASEEWMEAFESQGTPAMLRRCAGFAARCARDVANAGGSGGDLRARELVQDALGDLLLGTVRWDPNRKSLEQQLVDAIRWRARNERKRAARHLSLDGVSEGGTTHPTTMAEVEAALRSETADTEPAEERALQRLTQLRSLAAEDLEVTAMIGAYEQGARSKADVMSAIGLSTTAYHNARARLCRLAKQTKATSSDLNDQDRSHDHGQC
jgi:hypothetical protein